MPQTGPRFKRSDKPLLYREVVARLQARPRSAEELLEELHMEVRWDQPPTIHALHSCLRKWRFAGAVYDQPIDPKKPHVWHVTRNAMSKHVLQKALPQFHGLLPDETSGQEIEIDNQRPKLTAVATVSDLGTVERTPLDEGELLPPLDRLQRLVQGMPDELWQATMTRSGVLISFDQYQRVLALLAAITSAHEVA